MAGEEPGRDEEAVAEKLKMCKSLKISGELVASKALSSVSREYQISLRKIRLWCSPLIQARKSYWIRME